MRRTRSVSLVAAFTLLCGALTGITALAAAAPTPAATDQGWGCRTMQTGGCLGEQAIAFTSEVPTPAQIGQTYQVAATGGGSGNPVIFSTLTPAICTVDADTVTLLAAGTCTIAADQAGDSSWDPAPQATQVVTVEKLPTLTSLIMAPGFNSVYGAPTTVAAMSGVTSGDEALGNAASLQFALDGVPVGAPVQVTTLVPATIGFAVTGAESPPMTAGVGAHTVSATRLPDDAATYAASTDAETWVVNPAGTTTDLALTSDGFTAAVSAVAPGAGTPTGTVTFTVDGVGVGTAPLVNGVATLPRDLAAGAHGVAAAYAGDGNFLPSADTAGVQPPTITAVLTSAVGPTRGWYRTPVTISYRCTAGSAALSTACPAPVVQARSGAARTVTRTIKAVDGGLALVNVTLNIDRTPPRVRVTGTQAHPRCAATDALSGINRCRLTHRKVGTKISYRATATDNAGNVRTARRTFTPAGFGIAGLTSRHGVYTLPRGASYTLTALGGRRPRYVDAAFAPARPHGLDHYFTRAGRARGLPRWVVGVAISDDMRPGLWNLGVLVDGHLHVIKVRVTA